MIHESCNVLQTLYGKFVNVKNGKLTIFDLESGYNKKVLRVINLAAIYEAYKILYIKTDIDKIINLGTVVSDKRNRD